MYLIDTNVLIYYANASIPDNFRSEMDRILKQSFNISIITKLEYLGWRGFDSVSFSKAEQFVEYADIFHIDEEIARQTIRLRRNLKIRLADALIAATALVNDFTLLTRNQDDFSDIDELSLLNPFK